MVTIVQTVHGQVGCFGLSVSEAVGDNLVLQFHGGGLGQQDGIRIHSLQDDIADGAAQQLTVGVGEAGFDLHRPGGGIDHATDSLYASLPSVERAVIQLQADFRHLGNHLVYGTVLCPELTQLVFGDGEIGVHFRIVGNYREGLRHAGTDKCADAERKRAYHSVAGTFYLGIGEIVAGIRFLSLCLFEFGKCYRQPVAGKREFVIGYDFLIKQGLLALQLVRAVSTFACAALTFACAVRKAA